MGALDDADVFRLLATLAEGLDASERERLWREAVAVAERALELVRRRWDAAHAPVPLALLDAWFALAARLPEAPRAPDVTATWIELLPTSRVDIHDVSELARLDDWLALAAVLAENDAESLARYGFPQRQEPVLDALVDEARAHAHELPPDERDLLVRALRRLGRLHPTYADRARDVTSRERRAEPYRPRPRARERSAPLPDEGVVARVLLDLRARS